MKAPLEPVLTRLKPVTEKARAFLNTRSPSERQMLIVFGILIVVALDYLLLVQPIVGVFTKNSPQLANLRAEIGARQDDRNNRRLIETKTTEALAELELKRKRFIAADELPAFLESLSKLASDSGLKILMLTPSAVAAEEGQHPYVRTPLRIDAQAGTHELGKFLSRLETHEIFFKVTGIRISDNPNDTRRHSVELTIDVYRIERLAKGKT